MVEFEKLKKIILATKPANIEHLKQFSEKLKDDSTRFSVVNDLSKLLPAIFKYAFHEEAKFRDAARPAFIELVNILDLNKHLKEKPWWSHLKQTILESVDILMKLVSTDENWAVLWSTIVALLGTDLRMELPVLNKLLKVVEKAFKMSNENVRLKGFECWCKLIDNFSINKNELNNKRRLNLLVIPLKANNHNTSKLCASKMLTWKHLLAKLDQHNEMTVQLLISHFLEFMFGGVGSLPPACKTLNTDCADVLLQLLRTPVLFRVLPELFIKYTFVCIEHVHEDPALSLRIWEGLLENLKRLQWAENLVSELITCLVNSTNNETFANSKTIAQMVYSLYSGPHSMETGLLVKYMKAILSIALGPHVLSNFTESWCNELLDIIAKTDPALLPEPPDIMDQTIKQLNVLSKTQIFRDVKFLRGIWITVSNIFCKWMTEDGQVGKNGSLKTDMQNAHLLLVFGVADLSSMWNKFQMKSWKNLYSECVKYFSLLPEVKSDGFLTDLIELLLEGVQNSKIPLHVAVDVVSIILEFHLSKDASSILPLMMEVANSGLNALLHDVAGTALLSNYIKIIVAAARSEPALVNDFLTVIDKLFKYENEIPLRIRGKVMNMVLKAQHQLVALKPSRIPDKYDTPGSSTAQPASSPTVTSFLHRLAKAKESKSKVCSPTSSQSSDMSSSPIQTPNSKKSSSPFTDLKSEDFVFVPPKSRKTILTDHQKESFRTRKHDIPALYQDLSQDNSQSSYESIVTSVQTVEDDTNKTHEWHSPKKQKNFIELELKVLTPKKTSDCNLKTSTDINTPQGRLLSNKENDYFNNISNSPFSSVGKQEKSVSVDTTPLKARLQDDSFKQSLCTTPNGTDGNVDLKANPQSRNLRSNKNSRSSLNEDKKNQNSDTNFKDDSALETVESNEITYCSNTGIDCQNNQESGKQPEVLFIEEVKNSNTKSPSKNSNGFTKDNYVNEQDTPKRRLSRNRLIISVKKSVKKGTDEEPQNNEKSPKISPRRLRKRSSGVTPVLSSGGFVKKKKLNLSQTPAKTKVIRHSNESVDKNYKSTCDKKSDSSKNSIVIKDNEQPITKKDTKNESITETNSTKHNSESPINTVVSSENESQKYSEENEREKVRNTSQIKQLREENLIMTTNSSSVTCSPVKVVLSRLTDDHETTVDCNKDKPEDCIEHRIDKETGSKEMAKDCKNLKNSIPVKNLMSAYDVQNEETTFIEKKKQQNKHEENLVDEIILSARKKSCLPSELLSTTKDLKTSYNKQLIVEKINENDELYKNIKESVEGDNKSVIKTRSVQPKSDIKVNNKEKLPVKLNELVEREPVLTVPKLHSPVKSKVSVEFISDSNDVSHIKESGDNNVLIKRNPNNIIYDQSVETDENKRVSKCSPDMEYSSGAEQNTEDVPNLLRGKKISPLKKTHCSPIKVLPGSNDSLTGYDSVSCKKLNIETVSPIVKEDDNITAQHISKEDVNTLSSEKKPSNIIDKSFLRVTRSMEFSEDFKITHEETQKNVEVDEAMDIKKNISIEKSNKLNENKDTNEFSQLQKVTGLPTPRETRSSTKEFVCREIVSNIEEMNSEESSPNQEEMLVSKKNVEDNVKSDILDSSVAVSKQTSSRSTPIKLGQKQLKQTQLPFTPIQKSEHNLKKCEEIKSVEKEQDQTNSEQNVSTVTNDIEPHSEHNNEKLPLIVLTKLNNSDIICKLSPGKDQNISTKRNISAIEINRMETSSPTVNGKLDEPPKHSNNQEAPRTPEKSSSLETTTQVHILEVGPSQESVIEITESQDIIESSQENNLQKQSLLNGSRAACVGSLGTLKLLSKSPKKYEAICFNNTNNVSDRILRSSPAKDENLRHSNTPLKKSVCRRLDIEIDVSSNNTEIDSANRKTSKFSSNKRDSSQLSLDSDDSEELLNDIKFLNGDEKLRQNKVSVDIVDIGLTASFNIEDVQPSTSTANISPSTYKKLKRFSSEVNSGSTESSSRCLGSHWLDGSGSPKSPSSRTNQMMELAMKDKEKPISSPVSSLKKRRINPLRLGPILKTGQSPSTAIIQRSHNGPSEEWIRRTYSPTASPNSSILKRKGDAPTDSPDSSPPSLKKKRVSFLDPPVSESLLFSKAVPGKGHIQRAEHKRESESEEIISQGSVSVSPTKPSSDKRIYSPLKLCPNPLTDIIERIVSIQWASELENQLVRLGVTTVGQLSSLTEATIVRLPFIPPKLERLRKILQNYYNEINEKPENTKTESNTLENEECAIPSDEPQTLTEPCREIDVDLTSPVCDDSQSPDTVNAIADNIKRDIELHPQLINELGSRLDVEIIMSMLKCAVTKLKNQNDTS